MGIAVDYPLMPGSNPKIKAIQAKTFEAALERTADRLRWVIARVPIDLAQIWCKRGQIKVQGKSTALLLPPLCSLTVRGITFLSSTKKC